MTDKLSFHQPISRKIIIAALLFGGAGWLVLSVGLLIPIIGTEINADPHELFITVGAALTGPIGGMVVALIADSARPSSNYKVIIIIVHMVGGVWMGITYKTLVYQRLKMPLLLAGWMGLVLVYYYLILAPTVVIMAALGFSPPEFIQGLDQMTHWQLYFMSAKIGSIEAVITISLSTIIIAALPPKYRRPLW